MESVGLEATAATCVPPLFSVEAIEHHQLGIPSGLLGQLVGAPFGDAMRLGVSRVRRMTFAVDFWASNSFWDILG